MAVKAACMPAGPPPAMTTFFFFTAGAIEVSVGYSMLRPTMGFTEQRVDKKVPAHQLQRMHGRISSFFPNTDFRIISGSAIKGRAIATKSAQPSERILSA